MYIKPLSRCDVEELAAAQVAKPSPGVMFARNPHREQKDEARKLILDLLSWQSREEFLSVLSMPSLDWRFERKLLGNREGNWARDNEYLRNTRITAVENDRFIYYSAAHKMPGLHSPNALTTVYPRAPYSERSIGTKLIDRFHFANVDDLMAETDEQWDAVWLDYTGPMTVARLRLISSFFEKNIRETLIVTVLKARYNKEAGLAIARAGGHSEWLRKSLPGEVLHDIEYFDTAPMAQIAIRKA